LCSPAESRPPVCPGPDAPPPAERPTKSAADPEGRECMDSRRIVVVCDLGRFALWAIRRELLPTGPFTERAHPFTNDFPEQLMPLPCLELYFLARHLVACRRKEVLAGAAVRIGRVVDR
jgi:hypothetical protein